MVKGIVDLDSLKFSGVELELVAIAQLFRIEFSDPAFINPAGRTHENLCHFFSSSSCAWAHAMRRCRHFLAHAMRAGSREAASLKSHFRNPKRKSHEQIALLVWFHA